MVVGIMFCELTPRDIVIKLHNFIHDILYLYAGIYYLHEVWPPIVIAIVNSKQHFGTHLTGAVHFRCMLAI